MGLLLLGVHHTCTIAVNARGTVEGICLLGGDGGLRGASAENWRRGSVATISKSAEGNLPPRIWEFSAEADLRSLGRPSHGESGVGSRHGASNKRHGGCEIVRTHPSPSVSAPEQSLEGLHSELPGSLTSPSGHAVQVLASGPLNVLARHGAHAAVPVLNCPAAQGMQALEVVPDGPCPGGHTSGMQAEAPGMLVVPGGHWVHVTEPLPLNFPAAQMPLHSKLTRPGTDPKVPAGQGLHAAA